jgi:PPP family 3-phenylpropionic acid transporter
VHGALYAAFGVQSPYLPSLLDSHGLPPEAIALVLAAGTAIRLAAGPVAGRLADTLDAPKAVLIVCSAAAGLNRAGVSAGAGLMAAVNCWRHPFGSIGSARAAQRYAGSQQRGSRPTE